MAEHGPQPQVLRGNKGYAPTPSSPNWNIAISPPSYRPSAIARSSPSLTATATPCENSSRGASQSSSTVANWPPATTSPLIGTSASYSLHRIDPGSSNSSTQPGVTSVSDPHPQGQRLASHIGCGLGSVDTYRSHRAMAAMVTTAR
jgi:hypothetical protein